MFRILKLLLVLAGVALGCAWRVFELFLQFGHEGDGSEDTGPSRGRTMMGRVEPIAYNDDGDRVGACSGRSLHGW